MSVTSLSVQLSALVDSLKSTNTLISRLSKLQFQLGTEPLDSEDGVRLELAQDIHDSLKQLEEELEFITQEVEDYKFEATQRRQKSSRDEETARLGAKVTRLTEELTHSRQQFRHAQLKAKLASDEAKRQEREAVFERCRTEVGEQSSASVGNDRDLLFAHRGKRTQQQKQLTKDEILINASSDVTAALRRTHDLLSTELSRSRFAQETFDESTAALAQLGEDYSNLDTILSSSKNLLGTLLRSQKSDTWYLETAFYILLTTLCWLFFRRILFGPFVKLPIFFWNTFAFLTNWLFLRPLIFLFSITGVITPEPVVRKPAVSSSSRPPLIVQPSATGRVSAPAYLGNDPRPGIPAGLGGAGARIDRDHILQGKMSEQIGRMAKDGEKQAETTPKQEEKEAPRRGDGTVLQDRGDIPTNPKKKSFEADVEDGKHEAAQRNKRDEL